MEHQHLFEAAIDIFHRHVKNIVYIRSMSKVKANNLYIPSHLQYKLNNLIYLVKDTYKRELLFNAIYTFIAESFNLIHGDMIRNDTANIVCIYYKNNDVQTIGKVNYTIQDHIAMIPDNFRILCNLPLTYWD